MLWIVFYIQVSEILKSLRSLLYTPNLQNDFSKDETDY